MGLNDGKWNNTEQICLVKSQDRLSYLLPVVILKNIGGLFYRSEKKKSIKNDVIFFMFLQQEGADLRSKSRSGLWILKFLYFHMNTGLLFDCQCPKDKCKSQAFLL